MIKTPKFWYQPTSWLSTLLTPLSYIYKYGYEARSYLQRPRKLEVPVVCIGNLVAGGAGKTPTAIALGELFKNIGLDVHFLTRGYGGKESGPCLVTPHHSASFVGDEPLLLAKAGTTWVSHKRYRGAKAAERAGAQVILMDDGLQNFSIQKALSLLVIDGERAFGNKKLLPAGPMRETLPQALNRIDAIILIGKDKHHLEKKLSAKHPLFRAHLHPKGDIWEKLRKKRVVAFSGIAHPSKFFDTLRHQGCAVIGQRPFPDHHPYQGSDLRPLIQRAAESKATLVTTVKDFVRIPSKYQSHITPMPIHLQFEKTEAIQTFLQERIAPLIPAKRTHQKS